MKYFLIKNGYLDSTVVTMGGGDPAMHAAELFSLHDVSCYEMSDTLWATLRSTWDTRVVEIDYNVAYYGSTFFSEIRETGKLLETSDEIWTTPVKVPVDITPELVGYIVDFMQKIGIEIINSEFDRRFKTFIGVSQIEKESWEIQKAEAKEWLTYQGEDGHVTPFLDYLAEQQEIDKDALSNKILEKAESYQDQLSTMLVTYKQLIKELKSYDSVWDINIFYETYLGYFMPDSQAVQIEGWTVSSEDATRVNEVKVNEFNF